MQALPHIIKGVYGGTKNIRSLQIKTSESTSLPIYDAGKIDEENDNDDDDEEEGWEDY